MLNGAQQNASWLNSRILRAAIENNPGYLFLAGVCLASLTFYWVGPQLILFTGLISAAIVHTLYPKETEKWLKDHEFLFAGGAFGYLLGGIVGTLVGLWLGHFIAEKYNQALGVASQVTRVVDPVLHPLNFARDKMRSMNQWLRSLVIAEEPEQASAPMVDDPAPVNAGALVVRAPGPRPLQIRTIPELLINFNEWSKQALQEFNAQQSLSFLRLPLRIWGLRSQPAEVPSAPVLAIEHHAHINQAASQANQENNEAQIREGAIVLARAPVVSFRGVQQSNAIYRPQSPNAGCSMGMQFDIVREMHKLFSLFSPRRPGL